MRVAAAHRAAHAGSRRALRHICRTSANVEWRRAASRVPVTAREDASRAPIHRSAKIDGSSKAQAARITQGIARACACACAATAAATAAATPATAADAAASAAASS